MGAGVGLAVEDGDFGDHGVGWGDLVFPAEGREDGAGSNGGVEHFAKAFLRGVIEGGEVGEESRRGVLIESWGRSQTGALRD